MSGIEICYIAHFPKTRHMETPQGHNNDVQAGTGCAVSFGPPPLEPPGEARIASKTPKAPN